MQAECLSVGRYDYGLKSNLFLLMIMYKEKLVFTILQCRDLRNKEYPSDGCLNPSYLNSSQNGKSYY